MIHPDALAPLLQGPSREHWLAAARGEVRVPRCAACGHHFFPAATVCPRCLSEDVGWASVSGRAALFSWCEFHRPYFPALREKVPYVVVLAELEEGPLLYGNLVDAQADELRIGMALQAVCSAAAGDASGVDFRPAPDPAT